jgi:hypothetical protein
MRYDTVSKRLVPVACCSFEPDILCNASFNAPGPSLLLGYIIVVSCTDSVPSNFTVPAGATNLLVICIGSGAIGGGGLAWSYDIPCSPGQVFLVSPGGGDSTFGDPASGPYLNGGGALGTIGGTHSGNNVRLLGGNGGNGSLGFLGQRFYGGAGGYCGNGGSFQVDGSGGGGSGGYIISVPGGGVGFKYYTPYNGTLGAPGSVETGGNSYGGGGGSGGAIFIGWY